jgi:hypothetical protein
MNGLRLTGTGSTFDPVDECSTGVSAEAILQSIVVVNGPPGRPEPWTSTCLRAPLAAM